MLTLVAGSAHAQPVAADLARVDHLVFAAPDLHAGIAAIEKLTGIRAAVGGSHPGMGTRNALISLGPAVYLEIIAPDPEQADYRHPRVFRVDGIASPQLVTWAAKADDIAAIAGLPLADGSAIGAALAGSRKRPDGVTLSWVLTDPYTEIAGGVVPFFIDWGKTPHPAGNAPHGASLVALRAEHPDPERVRRMFAALELDVDVSAGPRPALIAVLDTPNGRVELR
jgi:hypothetical protein